MRPVHLRSDFKLAQRLFKGLGPDQRQKVVRQQGAGGQTLLHLAVAAQDSKFLQLLVSEVGGLWRRGTQAVDETRVLRCPVSPSVARSV